MLKIQKIVHKNYYQEIDSIRAIAVLLVVFFHFEMLNFTGGFLGVDVFFVLSGFLITKILSETEKKGFWLLFFFNLNSKIYLFGSLTIRVFFSNSSVLIAVKIKIAETITTATKLTIDAIAYDSSDMPVFNICEINTEVKVSKLLLQY